MATAACKGTHELQGVRQEPGESFEGWWLRVMLRCFGEVAERGEVDPTPPDHWCEKRAP